MCGCCCGQAICPTCRGRGTVPVPVIPFYPIYPQPIVIGRPWWTGLQPVPAFRQSFGVAGDTAGLRG